MMFIQMIYKEYIYLKQDIVRTFNEKDLTVLSDMKKVL